MSFELRIERLYAAIGASKHQLASVHAGKIDLIDGGFEVTQDFSGGASRAQLANELMQQIILLGGFPDHLRKRLTEIGKKCRKPEVEEFFKRDRRFCILYDLHNADKHGGRDSGGGWSHESPEIRNIRRIALCKTRASGGSTAGIMFDLPTGKPRAIGDGESVAATTGDILDGNGNLIGEAHEFIETALAVCEAAVDYFGAR